jgi:hypothetical protein
VSTKANASTSAMQVMAIAAAWRSGARKPDLVATAVFRGAPEASPRDRIRPEIYYGQGGLIAAPPNAMRCAGKPCAATEARGTTGSGHDR